MLMNAQPVLLRPETLTLRDRPSASFRRKRSSTAKPCSRAVVKSWSSTATASIACGTPATTSWSWPS